MTHWFPDLNTMVIFFLVNQFIKILATMANFSNNSSNSSSANNSNASSPCFINFTNESECYCPKDFYGPQCQYNNPVVCSMSFENPQQCNYFNNYYYVSDYSGDPPCNFIKENDVFIVKLILKNIRNFLFFHF